MIGKDKRVVFTLDAGGTNFVFSAIQGGQQIGNSLTLPAHGDNLEVSLQNIYKGFDSLYKQISIKPKAISFAFPGPADYPNGIIGDLGNMPAYRGGVPLGSFLKEKFQIPVFINNDGDLFAYGEAITGLLPKINKTMAKRNLPFRYKNLLGITLGTGFGAGIVVDKQLYLGDNSAGAEIWLTRHAFEPELFAEESISARAIIQSYQKFNTENALSSLLPQDIYEIAKGIKQGNKSAALNSFNEFGRNLGEILANAITLLDCNIVIGGGLSNAYDLFAPAMMQQLNSKLHSRSGQMIERLEVQVYDLECKEQNAQFYNRTTTKLTIPNTNITINYNRQKIVGVGRSLLGTSKAVSIGAYAFALHSIDKP